MQRFAWDSGRFDGFGVIAACAGLAWAKHPRVQGRWTAFVPVLVLGPVLLLIHEAQLLMFLPLWLVWIVWSAEGHTGRFRQALFAGTLFLLFTAFAVWITEAGVLREMSHEAFVVHLRERGARVDSLAAWIPFRDVNENLVYNTGLLFRGTVLPHHVLYLVGILPAALVFFRLFRALFPHVPGLPVLLLACLAPLALYAVGLDHFRWHALAITNLFLLTTLVASRPLAREAVLDICAQNRAWIYACVIFAFVTGSLADTGSYALFDALARIWDMRAFGPG